jgi:hypothetical protein
VRDGRRLFWQIGMMLIEPEQRAQHLGIAEGERGRFDRIGKRDARFPAERTDLSVGNDFTEWLLVLHDGP